MRSALLAVDGVTRVQVSIETQEVIVTYDPRLVTVDRLVEVLNETDGPAGPSQYTASIKVAPRAAPSAQ